MNILPTYIRELDFEDWLEHSPNAERVTPANLSEFVDLLSSEVDLDSYAVSPAYYAFTGRRGLWLYHLDKTYVPICWHPNVDGQVLIFPPRGEKDYTAIAALIDEAPVPPKGFHLSRFKPRDLARLKTFYAFVRRVSFKPVEEKVLDWKYPVRILSTLNTANMLGSNYMLIRNRVRQTNKYGVDVKPLTLDQLPEVEKLAYQWANKQAERPDELLDLVSPYQYTLRLMKEQRLGLSGLTFSVDGKIQATMIWDVSNPEHKIANLYMNLCNVSYRGLSEFTIKETAAVMCEMEIPFLNLGGSETAGLDHYKNKFSPMFSIDLCSLEGSARKIITSIDPPSIGKELWVA